MLYGAMSSIQTNENGDRMEAKPDIHATTYSWLRGLNPTEELGGQGTSLACLHQGTIGVAVISIRPRSLVIG